MKAISKVLFISIIITLLFTACKVQKSKAISFGQRKLTSAVWDFQTFSGKANANIQSLNLNQDFNLHIRMKSDSVIWISFTGFLNIEGFRVFITPDTLRILDRLSNIAYEANFQALIKKYKVPLQFNQLQKLLISSAFYNLDSISVANNSSDIRIDEKNFVYFLNPQNYTVTDFRLKDHAGIQTLKANFEQYTTAKGHPFALGYKILTGFNNEEIALNYTYQTFTFDEGIEVPFQVPSSFQTKTFK